MVRWEIQNVFFNQLGFRFRDKPHSRSSTLIHPAALQLVVPSFSYLTP